MIDRPDVHSVILEKAAELAGHPVRLDIRVDGESNGDAFGRLMERAKGLDNVTIK